MIAKARSAAIVSAIAAVYAVTTVPLGSLGYSWLQVRISEALTPLPYVFGVPAVFGLTIGVAVSNIFSPIGLPDLIFGPLLTLAAAIMTYRFNFGKRLVACIYPIVINAFGVAAYVSVFYKVPYEITVLTIGVGETLAVIIGGYPLLRAIEYLGRFQR